MCAVIGNSPDATGIIPAIPGWVTLLGVQEPVCGQDLVYLSSTLDPLHGEEEVKENDTMEYIVVPTPMLILLVLEP